ncbi:unnamed protein product [Prorocentrum cordatum]|uniref:Uncharacterized protein n=1 Tax=Prorocentrum cordatum TaxID=2364126 RepID=A0ABN9TAK8_9DINO|nr:unnamed protein product [Polarella glacialis]
MGASPSRPRRAAAVLALAAGASVAALALAFVFAPRRRASDGAETPTAAPEPPAIGPDQAAPGSGDGADDHALDEGLRALGMLSGASLSVAALDRPARAGAPALPYDEGVDGADDYVVVNRVSPEEEERRYFANLSGGADPFGGLPAPAEEETVPSGVRPRRPVVAYDS